MYGNWEKVNWSLFSYIHFDKEYGNISPSTVMPINHFNRTMFKCKDNKNHEIIYNVSINEDENYRINIYLIYICNENLTKIQQIIFILIFLLKFYSK